MVPTELDSNSHNHALINAALAAGLHPKILSIDMRSERLQTITNNQLVAFHPSSVNFKKKPLDFGANHLAYFTLMSVYHNTRVEYC
jgi:ATP-dependent RNA helicase DHX29